MLIEQDMCEDDDDDFACGRAYGGSRVAVVSMARYNPDADEAQGIDTEHAWPATHCRAFVDSTSDATIEGSGGSPSDPIMLSSRPINDTRSDNMRESLTALEKAVTSYSHIRESLDNSSLTDPKTVLWMGRVARTVSHELGHCFGIEHCVYYACAMQGSASIAEDARQPPYLCPVDLAKVLEATGGDLEERYRRLENFCARHCGGTFFEPFQAWLAERRIQTKK